MRKRITAFLGMFVVAFALGGVISQALVSEAQAGPRCDVAQICVAYSSSCSQCGGGPCWKGYSQRTLSGDCCGSFTVSCE